MLTIYSATKYHDWLRETIAKEDRLHELIRIVDYLDERPIPQAYSLVIKEDAIFPLIDWRDQLPPYLLGEKLELREANLLGLIFARLDNYERVYHYLANIDPALNHELDIYNRLSHGLHIDLSDLPSSLDFYDEYRLMHNQAIVRHYGLEEADLEQTKYYYLQALETAPTGDHRAFSAKHFGQLLTDLEDIEDATRVFQIGLASAESEAAKKALGYALAHARLQTKETLTIAELAVVKDHLWAALKSYEQQDRPLETALVLLDATAVCHRETSWSEGLSYVTRAIGIFEDLGEETLIADAFMRKGSLLFAWAQDDNPQFYRKAAEALQKAVRTFTRDKHPEVYADLQQQLGLIYAEIPDDAKKKGMWAAISSTAFQEAMSVCDKATNPQLYAAICNHYGNALLKYPQAKLTDNAEKALYYYNEALELRPATTSAGPRSITLLNYLEAQWQLGTDEDELDEARFSDMLQKAEEIIAISPDESLVDQAREHISRLDLLKTAYA
ncbi:MAG: hypothetical protein AAGF87_15445 [Bacteroidota bacterium]